MLALKETRQTSEKECKGQCRLLLKEMGGNVGGASHVSHTLEFSISRSMRYDNFEF